MRRSILAPLCAVAILTISCATSVSLPDKLDDFVEKTEKEYKNYTEDDWKRSSEEYQALMDEMEKNYDSYSTSEKVRAMQAMARYNKMVLENSLSATSESISDVLESIPEAINDIIDNIDTTAIRESVDSIKTGVEGIIESIDTAKLRKSIEGLTQSIDTAKLREKLEAIITIFSE